MMYMQKFMDIFSMKILKRVSSKPMGALSPAVVSDKVFDRIWEVVRDKTFERIEMGVKRYVIREIS